MKKFIEISLPNKNPMLVRVDAINSLVFQSNQTGDGGLLILTIAGWDDPFTYGGDDARTHFAGIKEHLLKFKTDQ